MQLWRGDDRCCKTFGGDGGGCEEGRVEYVLRLRVQYATNERSVGTTSLAAAVAVRFAPGLTG